MGCYISYSEEGPGRAAAPRMQSPHRCTKCNNPPINGQCIRITVLLYDGPLLCGFNVAIKGLTISTKFLDIRFTNLDKQMDTHTLLYCIIHMHAYFVLYACCNKDDNFSSTGSSNFTMVYLITLQLQGRWTEDVSEERRLVLAPKIRWNCTSKRNRNRLRHRSRTWRQVCAWTRRSCAFGFVTEDSAINASKLRSDSSPRMHIDNRNNDIVQTVNYSANWE